MYVKKTIVPNMTPIFLKNFHIFDLHVCFYANRNTLSMKISTTKKIIRENTPLKEYFYHTNGRY